VYRLLQRTVAPAIRVVWRLQVHGRERVPGGALVVAANHESLLDPFFLGAAFERPLRFVAKEELWRFRPVGWVLSACGAISVSRGRGDRGAIAAGVRALASGDAIAIFPQGTALPFRHRPWLRGAARLALATGAPILPVALVNTEKALRPGKPKVGFPRVRVLIGEPIAVERADATIAASKDLMTLVEKAIGDLCRPYGPPAHAWRD
jgi:1-acyl-sn-glycerol-3-phosphate acyltransferase